MAFGQLLPQTNGFQKSCTVHIVVQREHIVQKRLNGVDDNDYQPTENDTPQQKYFQFEEEFLKDEFNINGELKKSTITPDPDIIYSDEWCSCGHKKINCDCKAGCKCECNKRYLEAY